jgi:hypothetical protein
MTSGRVRGAAFAWFTAALLGGASARSEEPNAPPPATVSSATPKRQVPDYDGRGSPPTTAGDVAIWVPRIVLSPLYFTSEFIIRRPLGAVISGAERANLPTILYNFFTFGPDKKAGFAPVAFIDFGFNPSVGVYVFWDDAFFKGNDLRFHGSIWTTDWLAGSLTERIHFHKASTLTLQLSAVRRPDHVFYGIGPSTPQSSQSRYGEDLINAGALLDLPFWRASRVQTGLGVRSASLYHGHYGSDPSLEQQASAGVFPLPPGFADGYTAEYNYVLAAVDSRRPRPAPGSGIRVEFAAEQGSDFRQSPGSGWVRYAAGAGGFLDLNDHGRVLSLAVTGVFADPLGERPIPFTELASLGGNEPMPGFYPGRLVDRSAVAATAAYRWPIWVWLDGSIQAAVGNVFGEHLSGFTPGLLRFSGAIGVESVGSSPDSSFELLAGFGSETFDHGGQIDSIRVFLGTNRF